MTGPPGVSATPAPAADTVRSWTEDQALDLVTRQGYSFRQAERMTGFAADWLRDHARRHRPMVEAATRAAGAGPVPTVPRSLSSRESDVLALAADGLTSIEIAARLGCSERTVKTSLQAVVDRFGLRNRTHAVAYALRTGLIE